MFSIIMPTFNNLNYLKLCIESIKKNSKFDNELIIHVNEGIDGSFEYIKQQKINYTYSKNNIGLCSAVNTAAKKSTLEYILYTHDDMYFCPGWDLVLKNELEKLNTKLFYLSASMIEKNSGHIKFDCGTNYKDFDEDKLLKNHDNLKCSDFQGSHWAPHLIHKEIWNKIGGFSEEFNPGIGSDPDLNMKLWKEGVRIFKGLSEFKVYHFGSISLRKKPTLIQNKGAKTFLKKWGITTNFFKKYYLKSDTPYYGPLSEPKKNINYYLSLFICKLKYFFIF
mgnify:FL=1|tara:strand:+ start:868 stop:1704 length:837 start_codon:yes stop_codon:yes gene_type:complete